MIWLSIFEGLFVILALVVCNYFYKRRKLPPGPSPLPILGYKLLFDKGKNPEDAYIEWRKQYGDIFTIWNPKPMVVIAGYDKIIETFQKDGDAYAGRPTEFANSKLYVMTRGEPRGGVVLTEGDLWRDHRRFALHVLRDFGLGKDLMQERVLDEVAALLSKINADIEAGTREHNLPARMDVAVGSIINSLLFGYRFDHGHEKEFFELKSLVAQEIRFAGHRIFHLLNKYPTVFSRLPFGKQMFEQLRHARRQLFDFYQRQIDDHVKGIDFEI